MRTILPHTHNPLLRDIAREVPISEITSSTIRTLIADMKHLLAREQYGVAIAAPQIGESLRIFVVSGKALSKRSDNDEDENTLEKDIEGSSALASVSSTRSITEIDQVYINPVMLKVSRGKVLKHEGCLSVKGKWGHVARAEKATIRAYDEHGALFTRGAAGFLAHVFQHEMDHLDGILYIDKAKDLQDDKPEDDE